MSQFVERCGAVNPSDGTFCQLPKGHGGNHSATGQPQQPPPQAPQQVPQFAPQPRYMPPQRAGGSGLGCFGIGCLSLVGVFIVLALIGSCANSMTSTPTNRSTSSASDSRYKIKAVANESRASSLVGGFGDDDRRLYHAGLQHIYNVHDKVGSYTIGQVIDLERAREQARADEARQQAEQRKEAEEANYMHGTPDCLILDKRTLTTESGDDTWYIEGKVTNKCDRDFRYAQVEFTFYDTDGNQTASGLVNINNLDAGQTWSFKKGVYETQGAGKWRVSALSAF